MAKWRYFDDQPAPSGMWVDVCNIIKYAENLSMLNTSLFMYEAQIIETSVAALLEHGFMLSTLQKGNFSRLQIQLTDQVMKILATNPMILNKYKQDIFQFCMDVSTDAGPVRIEQV